jgi:hypothetical protein
MSISSNQSVTKLARIRLASGASLQCILVTLNKSNRKIIAASIHTQLLRIQILPIDSVPDSEKRNGDTLNGSNKSQLARGIINTIEPISSV